MNNWDIFRRLDSVVVRLILDGRVEEALEILAHEHQVKIPRIRVGLPKRSKRRAMGCYASKNETISVANSDTLKNPFVILHEFYHHLRTSADGKHRGTEKRADTFAKDFLQAYALITNNEMGNN